MTELIFIVLKITWNTVHSPCSVILCAILDFIKVLWSQPTSVSCLMSQINAKIKFKDSKMDWTGNIASLNFPSRILPELNSNLFRCPYTNDYYGIWTMKYYSYINYFWKKHPKRISSCKIILFKNYFLLIWNWSIYQCHLLMEIILQDHTE